MEEVHFESQGGEHNSPGSIRDNLFENGEVWAWRWGLKGIGPAERGHMERTEMCRGC